MNMRRWRWFSKDIEHLPSHFVGPGKTVSATVGQTLSAGRPGGLECHQPTHFTSPNWWPSFDHSAIQHRGLLTGEVMPGVGGYALARSTTCTFVPLSWRTLSTPVALS